MSKVPQGIRQLANSVMGKLENDYVLAGESDQHRDLLTNMLNSMVLHEKDKELRVFTITHIHQRKSYFKQRDYFDLGEIDYIELDKADVYYGSFHVIVRGDYIERDTLIPHNKGKLFEEEYGYDYRNAKSLVKEYGIGVLDDE